MTKKSLLFASATSFFIFIESVFSQCTYIENKRQSKSQRTKYYRQLHYDIYAPKGIKFPESFENKNKKIGPLSISKPSVVEVLYTDTSMNNIDIFLESIKKDFDENIIPIIISLKNLPSKTKQYLLEKNPKIIFWEQKIVIAFSNYFQIQYINSLDLNRLFNNKHLENVTVDTFLEYTNTLISKIKEKYKDIAISLVLGAGVSCSQGAASWNDLMENFESILRSNISSNGITKSLFKSIGASDLNKAQLSRELLFTNPNLYFGNIYDSIYPSNSEVLKTDVLAYEVSALIAKYHDVRNFKVLSYNYDNYIERFLTEYFSINYNATYSASNKINKQLTIYHVHGYLPYNTDKNLSITNQYFQNSIKLTEGDYNEMYNDPYKWEIATQLSFFRENTCLFIGCSLIDPNIRRLLRITSADKNFNSKKHYAILPTNYMNAEELSILSNHFAKIGIQILWARDFDHIKDIVHAIRSE